MIIKYLAHWNVVTVLTKKRIVLDLKFDSFFSKALNFFVLISEGRHKYVK